MRKWLWLTVFIGHAALGCKSEKPSAEKPLVNNANRERLVQRINRNGDVNNINTPSPLVTLEEFFEGNDDYGSIGYNLYPDQPSPAEFYEMFKRIRSHPEVADVRVEVLDHEDPDGWPASELIWIITTASAEEVKEWIDPRFHPDEVFEGFRGRNCEPYELPDGMNAVGVWWD